MTRLLLISAVNSDSDVAARPFPPLGLGHVASYLREYRGPSEIKIISRSLDIQLDSVLTDFQPDIVGISSTTQEFNTAVGLARQVKEWRKVPVVVGGHHISALPSTLPEDMDVAVLGEGEETMAELIETHESGGGLVGTDLSGIKGIAYHQNGEVVTNPPREPIEDLDGVPPPARDLLDMDSTWTHLMTSRGCPYKCIYCTAGFFWKRVRYFSPQYVLEEIRRLVSDFGVTNISIEDDLFIAKPSRLREIRDLFKQEGLDKEVDLSCLCRANLVTEEIADCLREMGVHHVSMGLESGSERVLNVIKGGSVSVEQGVKALKVLKDRGFETRGFFMLGLPGETTEDMQETFRLIRNPMLDSARVRVFVPLPGSKIWHDAVARGIVSNQMDWDDLNMEFETNFDRYPIVNDQVSRQELWDIYTEMTRYLDQREEADDALSGGLSLKNIWKGLTSPRKLMRVLGYKARALGKG